MKMVLSIFAAVVTLISSTSFASGTGDIGSGNEEKTVLWCSNPGLDVDVILKGSDVIVRYVGLDEVSVSATYSLQDGEKFNPQNFSIFAFTKMVETHGVIGEGISLSVKGKGGSIILNGTLQSLGCGKPGTPVGF